MQIHNGVETPLAISHWRENFPTTHHKEKPIQILIGGSIPIGRCSPTGGTTFRIPQIEQDRKIIISRLQNNTESFCKQCRVCQFLDKSDLIPSVRFQIGFELSPSLIISTTSGSPDAANLFNNDIILLPLSSIDASLS